MELTALLTVSTLVPRAVSALTRLAISALRALLTTSMPDCKLFRALVKFALVTLMVLNALVMRLLMASS